MRINQIVPSAGEGSDKCSADPIVRRATATTRLAAATLVFLASLIVPPAALGQSPPGQPAEEKPAEIVPAELRAQAATVRISTRDGHFLGCGVVIASGELEFQVLTAEHIVRATRQIVVHSFTPGHADALGPLVQHNSVQVLAEDARADLALLLVKSGIPPAGKLALAAQGQPAQSNAPFSAWVVNCNRPEAVQVLAARVTRRQTARRGATGQPVSFWQLAQPSQPGMSGGGLVNQSGELIGIASGNSGQHAYYSDETEISRFLAK